VQLRVESPITRQPLEAIDVRIATSPDGTPSAAEQYVQVFGHGAGVTEAGGRNAIRLNLRSSRLRRRNHSLIR
jgi:hypothetical protein